MRSSLAILVALTTPAWADDPPPRTAPLVEPAAAMPTSSLSDDPPPATGGRIAGEVMLGTLIGGIGLVGGGALGVAIECSSGCHGFLAGAGGAVIGGYVGGSIGIGIGVGLAGGDDVASGSIGAATGGALLGGLAGLAAAGLIAEGSHGSSDGAEAFAVAAVAAGWVGGGVVGYHLSRTRIEHATVVPMARRGGAGLALAGTF